MSNQASTGTRSKRTILGVLYSGSGVSALVLALLSAQFRFLGIACALASFLLAASVLSTAARVAGQLPMLVGRDVNLEVWGIALESSGPLRVNSVHVLGAGLHLYLELPPGSHPRDLKVAQPKTVRITEGRLEIADAAYVSWAGSKLKRDQSSHQTALVISWPAACAYG